MILGFVLWGGKAGAELRLSSRYDGWGSELRSSHRLIQQIEWIQKWSDFGLYADGFFDADMQNSSNPTRREASKAYLQELYFDYTGTQSVLRIGKQAIRWSEMWTLPSLDLWTARKYERFFVDPLKLQLSHSTGLRWTYESQGHNLDVVALTDLASTSYPEPLAIDDSADKRSGLQGGLKWSSDFAGFNGAILLAHKKEDGFAGLSVNYAFEHWVPKLEFAVQKKAATATTEAYHDFFSSFGGDIFWDEWVVSPQLTIFDFGDLRTRSNDFQSAYYLGINRTSSQWELQVQLLRNSTYEDEFASIYAAWFVKDWWTLGAFAQYYNGEDSLSVFKAMRNQIGSSGSLAGLRTELNYSF